MRVRASIFTFILSVLIIQPLFADFRFTKVEASATCKKEAKKSSCAVRSCEKQDEEKDMECEQNQCNPLLGCPTGNFYIHDYTKLTLSTFRVPKQKMSLIDDNRLAKQQSECFHPPEMI